MRPCSTLTDTYLPSTVDGLEPISLAPLLVLCDNYIIPSPRFEVVKELLKYYPNTLSA